MRSQADDPAPCRNERPACKLLWVLYLSRNRCWSLSSICCSGACKANFGQAVYPLILMSASGINPSSFPICSIRIQPCRRNFPSSRFILFSSCRSGRHKKGSGWRTESRMIAVLWSERGRAIPGHFRFRNTVGSAEGESASAKEIREN